MNRYPIYVCCKKIYRDYNATETFSVISYRTNTCMFAVALICVKAVQIERRFANDKSKVLRQLYHEYSKHSLLCNRSMKRVVITFLGTSTKCKEFSQGRSGAVLRLLTCIRELSSSNLDLIIAYYYFMDILWRRRILYFLHLLDAYN